MPRQLRCYAPNIPCHVITRGNNRQVCLLVEQDYQIYLGYLSDACKRYNVALHAYVLMANHVHLLLTPEIERGISRVMQSIGRRDVQYFNLTYKRSGTLWEGRHRASLIDSERYLLICYRYIELNPVRANIVSHPSYYQWSSHCQNAGLQPRQIIVPHDLYLPLGQDHSSRSRTYQVLFSTEMTSNQLLKIGNAATASMPLGDLHFRNKIESILGPKLAYPRRGLPFKSSA